VKTTSRKTYAKRMGAAMLLVAAIAIGGPAAAQERCDSACLQDKVDRHLLLMGEFDNEEALTASLRDLIASGAPVLRTVEETYAVWSRVEATEPDGSARPGEMRWRVVYLLGSLGMRDAVRPLYEIAKAELPDPRLDEQAFADELRIQLRAVAGLESLGAIDELRDLYRAGGLLRNATAASLFVLGENVGDVRRIDARTALAEERIEPTNFNPDAGRPAHLEMPRTDDVTPPRN